MRVDCRLLWCSMALSLGLLKPSLALIPSSSSVLLLTASPDSADVALRSTAQRYFTLFTAKDVDGLLSLWSKTSPDYASVKEDSERQFGAEDSRFGSPAFSRLKVEGEKASLRASVRSTLL